jgi:hypothetical protein
MWVTVLVLPVRRVAPLPSPLRASGVQGVSARADDITPTENRAFFLRRRPDLVTRSQLRRRIERPLARVRLVHEALDQ